jgi:hypothetical protein
MQFKIGFLFFQRSGKQLSRVMEKMMKYSLYALVIAGCLLPATGCVRRTVTQGSAYTNNTNQKNPARGDSIVEDQTYWFWQGGFWNRDKQ